MGVVNPRTDEIESVDTIVKKAEQALEFIPADRLMLNPDCGFATFANRPMNSYDIIAEKLKAMDQARRVLCQSLKE